MSASMEEMSGQIRKMIEPVFRKQNRALFVAHMLHGLTMRHGVLPNADVIVEAIRVAELVLAKLDVADMDNA